MWRLVTLATVAKRHKEYCFSDSVLRNQGWRTMSNINEDLMTMTVDEVLKKWPHTAQFFRQYALACVGCTIAPFCEIGKVAEIYSLPQEQFLNDLRAVIQGK